MEWKLMRKKTKVMRISRQPSSVKIMIDQKQLENVVSPPPNPQPGGPEYLS
jgi:hypothetical protein